MLGVDIGGTFTDVVAFRDGRILVTKVPSNAAHPEAAVLEGARRLGLSGSTVFNHASTKGLNAVLTRDLPKIGFMTTEGHRDLLDAGRCWRPFDGQLDARWRRSFGDAGRPLVRRYLRRGVRERLLADGSVLIPFEAAQARAELDLLKRCGIQGLAICLLHAYANAAHERQLLALAREVLGDIPISVSSEVSPRAKEFSRAATTVVDVFMKLLYGEYAQRLRSGLDALGFEGQLNFADCTAALLPWREALRRPHKILFAGPAAGTASCRRFGEIIGEPDLICCDVGGTSTDVSMITSGAAFTNDSFEIEHDLVISTLSTEVGSVGAGGGSLIGVSASGDITVGPRSAGAVPGPACYGRGGTLPTVTDACLLMGILEPRGFAGGQLELDRSAALAAFEALPSPLPVAERIRHAYQIAVQNIAEEVANTAIRHGADPRDFSLVAYGSAGPMLLASLMDLIGVRAVIVPPHPGLFSALGLISSDQVFSDSKTRYLILGPQSAVEVHAIFAELEAALRSAIGDVPGVTVRRSFDARLMGQTWETPFVDAPSGRIDAAAVAAMLESFHREYARRNGRQVPGIPVQAVCYRVQLIVPSPKVQFPRLAAGAAQQAAPGPLGTRVITGLSAEPLLASTYDRAALPAGTVIDGPAIIQEPLCTTLVGPGQCAEVGVYGELRIVKRSAVPA